MTNSKLKDVLSKAQQAQAAEAEKHDELDLEDLDAISGGLISEDPECHSLAACTSKA